VTKDVREALKLLVELVGHAEDGNYQLSAYEELVLDRAKRMLSEPEWVRVTPTSPKPEEREIDVCWLSGHATLGVSYLAAGHAQCKWWRYHTPFVHPEAN
jgi:hypothetical protein